MSHLNERWPSTQETNGKNMMMPTGASPHAAFHSKGKLVIFSLLPEASSKCVFHSCRITFFIDTEMVISPTDGLVFLKR